MIVAIDGPAGAGKSTVARALAERLGFRYLDTGAMYRALTWLALRQELPLDRGAELAELARANPVELDERGRVSIAGTDVTSSIREPRIDRVVPVVARHPQVREVMRERQRLLGTVGDAVIEGRDIGAVVAPDAAVKIYLQAEPEERARRRVAERPGIGADALVTDMRTRDERDKANTHLAPGAVVIDTTELTVEEVVDRIAQLVGGGDVNVTDGIWSVGRIVLGMPTRLFTLERVYAKERVPLEGGCVIACNHFSWIDPPALGAACPRTIYFMAKIEAHRVPGLGQLIRAFGTFPVRRGESDRDAVRTMRQIVRDGHALGLFVEGTRQRSGVPGDVQPGAAMVALQEGVPVVPVAVHGSQTWRPGNFDPVSIAFGNPMTFEGLPRGGRGYREASEQIRVELRRLWEWLVEQHELGRPRGATPP